MKALVTGAAGFIGARLCRELRRRGDEVLALALPGENVDHILNNITKTVTGDITVPESLARAVEEVDVVYHLAARVLDYGSRDQFYRPIFSGTSNLVEAMRGRAGRFVQVSSIAACGLGRHLRDVKEADPARKSGVPYNDAKADAEVVVRKNHENFPQGTVIARPANVIGPRSAWVDEVLRQFRRGPVPLLDHGRHSASLVFVDNLVDGLILAGTTPEASGQIYHFRDDWDVTWKRYLTDLSALIGKKPSLSLPFGWAWNLGAVLEAVLTPLGLRPPLTRLAAGVMGRDNDVDATKAREELGWRTKVSYSEAMAEISAYVGASLG
ncbi:MAG: NAD-dependent epimerase/dehydratase family protein [Pseudomonadota bacterium]